LFLYLLDFRCWLMQKETALLRPSANGMVRPCYRPLQHMML